MVIRPDGRVYKSKMRRQGKCCLRDSYYLIQTHSYLNDHASTTLTSAFFLKSCMTILVPHPLPKPRMAYKIDKAYHACSLESRVFRSQPHAASCALLAVACALLAGCGAVPSLAPPDPSAGHSLQGRIHGGL